MNSAQWICLPATEETVNLYHDFRHVFSTREASRDGLLKISVFGDFIVWLDDIIIGFGQFSDFPENSTFSEFPISSVPVGQHVLSVMTFCKGENSFTACAGTPRLFLQLELENQTIVTDENWHVRLDPVFRSGAMDKITWFLGCSFEADLRCEDQWRTLDFDEKSWQLARLDSCAIQPQRRPVPLLETWDAVPGVAIRSGSFLPCPGRERIARKVERVQSDAWQAISRLQETGELFFPGDGNGKIAIWELPEELSGFLTLEIEAAGGEILDISHGEHLQDGTIRCGIGDYAFTDRLVCKSGVNHFTYRFRRLSCKYIQLNMTRLTAQGVTVKLIGIAPRMLPLPETAPFFCSEPEQMKMRDMARRTLRLCMHEHYEDCPWREQSLYAYDSRNQALFGYYLWGNYQFAKSSFDLLGQGMRPDGMITVCAPTRCDSGIPSFTFAWVLEIAEHWLFSGDDSLFHKYCSEMELSLGMLGKHRASNGLLLVPTGENIWNFYEWVDGLGGDSGLCNAPYHLLFLIACRAFIRMKRWAGMNYESESRLFHELCHQVDQTFWDEEFGCYRTTCNDPRFHEYTQALALVLQLPSLERSERVIETLRQGKLYRTSLAALPYLMDGLANYHATDVLEKRLHEIYAPMLKQQNQTFWETARGADDFGKAGSLCHGWSCFPIYYQGAYLLGVKPLSPGFKEFEVSPLVGRCKHVAGGVPTPSGMIQVSCSDGICEVTAPAGLIRRFPEGSKVRQDA